MNSIDELFESWRKSNREYEKSFVEDGFDDARVGDEEREATEAP